MRSYIFTFLLLLGFFLCQAQTGKRGIAYGYHSPEDMEVMSPEISWWYNWAVTPESSVAYVYGDYGFDFVPMAWNGYFDETALREFLTDHPETKYLLAFNEPNFTEQANMTPSEAAAVWPQLEAIADDFDLILVGPAVNYCGNCVEENGTVYTDPFDYLDDFFAACSDCRVDHIAVHCYMNTVEALQWYIGEFKKYEKPIWLTEFAGWESNGNISSLNDQINYMIGAVDYLEADPNVFRYSWFIGRGPGIMNYPYIDLLGANGELTALGEIYKQMPVHDTSRVVDIPARIEAEAYNTMSGILIEKTADQTGFANVGWVDAGDWLEYRIHVPADDSYAVRFRLASTKSAGFDLLVDDIVTLSQDISNTGGWQNWSNFDNSIDLTAGEHHLRLQATSDGFNINWLQIGDVLLAMEEMRSGKHDFHVFPNPGDGILTIECTEPADIILIFTMSGELIKQLPFSSEIDMRELPHGIYLLKVIDTDGNVALTEKVSIN